MEPELAAVSNQLEIASGAHKVVISGAEMSAEEPTALRGMIGSGEVLGHPAAVCKRWAMSINSTCPALTDSLAIAQPSTMYWARFSAAASLYHFATLVTASFAAWIKVALACSLATWK